LCRAPSTPRHNPSAMDMLETRRLAFLEKHAVGKAPNGRKRIRLVPNSAAVVTGGATRIKPGARRVTRFIELLEQFATVPWASMRFNVNEMMLRRLVHAHLPLIAGDHYADEKNHLEALVNAPDKSGNVVWVTNRQQGKTSTLARFLAALVILSPMEGSLVCVYSTNLDRATELLKGAKMYILHLRPTSDVAVTILQNNERSMAVRTWEGAVHSVAARPRSADSCRGDAPKAAIFDEIAFVTPDFWYQFAYPLLQVGRRVFTCATTPPHFGSFFSLFVESVRKANAKGDNFFRLINHSLVCGECEKADIAEECAHRLFLVPPWKSVIKFWKMRTLVPENRLRDFEQEVYGVLTKQAGGYLPRKLIQAFIDRPRVAKCVAARSSPVYVAVDPPSHQRSRMGVAAIMWQPNGTIVCLGVAEIAALHSDTYQLMLVLGDFIRQLRRHPWISTFRTLVPIIEANNNSILSLSLLGTFKASPPMAMPFLERHFSRAIVDNVGVLTTEQNKHAMLQLTLTSMMDGRLFLCDPTITTGRQAYDARSKCKSAVDDIVLLGDELEAMRDQPDGKISGKLNSGQGDDLAMAFMMGLYWGQCCNALALWR